MVNSQFLKPNRLSMKNDVAFQFKLIRLKKTRQSVLFISVCNKSIFEFARSTFSSRSTRRPKFPKIVRRQPFKYPGGNEWKRGVALVCGENDWINAIISILGFTTKRAHFCNLPIYMRSCSVWAATQSRGLVKSRKLGRLSFGPRRIIGLLHNWVGLWCGVLHYIV